MSELYYVYVTEDGKKDAIVDAKKILGDFNEDTPYEDYLFLNKTIEMEEAQRIVASYREKVAAYNNVCEELKLAKEQGNQDMVKIYEKTKEAVSKQMVKHRIITPNKPNDLCPFCGDPLERDESRYCGNCGQRVEFEA